MAGRPVGGAVVERPGFGRIRTVNHKEDAMKLSIKALAIALGVVWGGCILLVGLAQLAWPGYGSAFLGMAGSIYPGFDPAGGAGAVVVGALYGFVDGAVGGAVLAWLYNKVAAAA